MHAAPVEGIAILLQEGVLGWLKYRNIRNPAIPMETKCHIRQSAGSAFIEEELVILFATMMGGNLYEPEF